MSNKIFNSLIRIIEVFKLKELYIKYMLFYTYKTYLKLRKTEYICKHINGKVSPMSRKGPSKKPPSGGVEMEGGFF